MDAFAQMNDYGSRKIPFLFVIDFELKKPFAIPLSQIDPSALLFNIEGNHNCSGRSEVPPSCNFSIRKPVSFDRYKSAFKYCSEQLKIGNSYLLNLTFPTEIETDLSLQQIFHLSRSKYKLWLRDDCVCFSPETFIKINNGMIYSFPMKGTIDAAIPDAGNLILNNAKETAEHYTIVDLIRNDLSMVATGVRVDRFRYIEKISTNKKDLLQLSSQISGKLPDDYADHIGDILLTLLPAGSVSGAPKKKTLQIIANAEQYQRGYYTGIFGVFDGVGLNSAVMIRFIEQRNGKLFYKSGGGITTQSCLEQEYNEMLDKVYLSV